MTRLTRSVIKIGPGGLAHVTVHSAEINDLIAQLIKIRDQHGNIPVVQTSKEYWGDEMETQVMEEDETPFEVHESSEDVHRIRAATAPWGYDGSVLEVHVDL